MYTSTCLGTSDKLLMMDRNEAGILTARKDQDYIGREELLEALTRVGCPISEYLENNDCGLWD